jgi:hypothetical protein
MQDVGDVRAGDRAEDRPDLDAPMAKRMSTPRSSVRAGTTIIPPPRPRSEPRTPAMKEMATTSRTKRSGVIRQSGG